MREKQRSRVSSGRGIMQGVIGGWDTSIGFVAQLTCGHTIQIAAGRRWAVPREARCPFQDCHGSDMLRPNL